MHRASTPPASSPPEPDPRAGDDPPARSEPQASGAPRPFFTLREIPSVHECELCGTVMYDHHCKIVCPNCGYKRDCSDP